MSMPADYVPINFTKNDLLSYMKEATMQCPNREAVISGDGHVRLSYEELHDRSNRLANALKSMGVGKGDRVAIFQTNRWQYVEKYLAILKLGAIVVPMNFRLKGPEAVFILIESGAKVLFFEERYTPLFETIKPYLLPVQKYICTVGKTPEWAENYENLVNSSQTEELPPVDLSLDSIAAICFTSGTTGLPKGAISTHRNIMVNFYDSLGESLSVYSVHPQKGCNLILLNVPIYHIAGILTIYRTLAKSSTLVIPEAFSPEVFMEIVQREEITSTYLVPTMFAMILNHQKYKEYNLNSLRTVGYGAMPMPPELLKRIIAEFPSHIKFMDAFGCTECNATTIAKLPEDHILTTTGPELNKKLERLKGVGRPLKEGISVRIIDEKGKDAPPGVVGEIICKGEKVTPGYWRNPERTQESFDTDGWFHTGDMARRDDEGYIYFSDRKKDMMNRGGENIYPLEVERVLMLHPKIQEVAVFGVPDPMWGHIVKAAVVVRGGETVSEEELIRFCKDRLASYKCPSAIHFMRELPRTFEGGKVLRYVLRNQLSQSSEK